MSTETPLEEQWIDLPSGCTVRVDVTRSLVELPLPKTLGDCGGAQKRERGDNDDEKNDGDDASKKRRWKVISSAIWNGGLRSFASETETRDEERKQKQAEKFNASGVRVFNYKVPSTYDGLDPEPKALIQNAIQKDYKRTTRTTTTRDADRSALRSAGFHEDATVGIMTAASMNSLRTASRSAGGVVVDAIVTAGISNSRSAGAAADFFGILPPETPGDDQKPPPGTINTIIVINGASLTDQAMIEAYAVAVEAKCSACLDYKVTCAKTASRIAQGTGTDCAVLLCPSLPPGASPSSCVHYAGKHCLLGELIGQAVREATGQAILSNLDFWYGKGTLGWWKYALDRYLKQAKALVLEGARPCVPARPMDAVPCASVDVVVLGSVWVLLCYSARKMLPLSATILLAAAVWDRCLPEPPLFIHPVVLAGRAISLATKVYLPEKVFDQRRPLLGFFSGVCFLVVTLVFFVSGGLVFVSALEWAEEASKCTNKPVPSLNQVVEFASWVFRVVLFKTTFSLQLLCTIALQMAGFLERSKLDQARAQLTWLCSRDPTLLNAEELAGGTLESLSENLSDGTIAPWFWYVLLGPSGALGYRVANTLDSRIGYRGGRYEYFGKASARFDDFTNLVPSRLTAGLLLLAAVLLEGSDSASRGWKTAVTDRGQCASPNAGWPMGAMAGILGVRLEKKGQYSLGKSLGGDARGPSPSDIRRGHTIAQVAGGIALVLALILLVVREALL